MGRGRPGRVLRNRFGEVSWAQVIGLDSGGVGVYSGCCYIILSSLPTVTSTLLLLKKSRALQMAISLMVGNTEYRHILKHHAALFKDAVGSTLHTDATGPSRRRTPK